MFHGKIHYKWPFSIATLNCQRVLSQTCHMELSIQSWLKNPPSYHPVLMNDHDIVVLKAMGLWGSIMTFQKTPLILYIIIYD